MLAVAVVSLLIAVTVQFSKEMRQELMSSANSLSINTLEIMAKSGYNLAEAVLLADIDKEEAAGDTLFDTWATLKKQELAPLYPTATLKVAINDLSGRVQLNSLLGSADGGDDAIAQRTADLLKRLLLSEDLPEVAPEQADLIVNAIMDWIDADDEEQPPGLESTESSFYRGLQPAYASKNGPMEFVEELLLIRGISKTLYYGNEEFLGLRDLVTVHGTDGKININTAPKAVLKALSAAMTEDLATKLVDFREDENNKELLNNKMWYTNELPADIVEIDADIVAVKSSFFQIIASAENNGVEKILKATVQRQSGKTIAVLSRKLE